MFEPRQHAVALCIKCRKTRREVTGNAFRPNGMPDFHWRGMMFPSRAVPNLV